MTEWGVEGGAGQTCAGRVEGHATATLLVLFFVALFGNLDRALISILQVPIKRDLSLSDAQLGGLTGLTFAIVYAIVSLPMGPMVDRYRRTWLLAGALTIWSLLTGASGFAQSYSALIVCRLGVAFGEACGNPASFSLLSDVYALRRRGTVFSLFQVAPFVGIFLGVVSGGWLSIDIGWRNSFFLVGLTGLLVVPFLLWLPEPRRGQSEEKESDGNAAPSSSPPFHLRAVLASLFHLRAFRLLVVGMTLQNFVTSTFLSWSAPFLSRLHHMSLVDVGLWTALPIGVGGAAGAIGSGVAVDYLARRNIGWYGWAPGLASAGFFPVAAVQFSAGSASSAIIISFLTAALASFYLAPVFATANSLVPAATRGTTTAVLMTIPAIFGTGLGPFVAGAVSDHISIAYGLGDESLRYALLVSFLPAFGAASSFFFMGRELAKVEARRR